MDALQNVTNWIKEDDRQVILTGNGNGYAIVFRDGTRTVRISHHGTSNKPLADLLGVGLDMITCEEVTR